jgi:small subunit ribosomal protein S2
MAEETLAPLEKYLKTGSHIGTTFKTGDMKRYIFKQRKDGLKVLDVENIDSRIKQVGAFLSTFDTDKIVVVSRKLYGQTPVRRFAEVTGAHVLTGRFVPGTFTNPGGKQFMEPHVIVVTDPDSDSQAVDEATRIRIPVVALCSTNNSVRNVDIIVPINNKGRKSLALVYWLLAREILVNNDHIKSRDIFDKTPDDFEYQMKAGDARPEEGFKKRAGKQKGGKNRGNRR